MVMYMIGQSLKESLEKRFNVIIQKHEDCDPNQAACAGNMIWVGEFDDPEIELAAIFHEIGHIKFLSSKTYTTVGIVVTEETVNELKNTIEFAISLGVHDVRIISAAQYNELLKVVETIPENTYENYPILKYRINNIKQNINVRGIKPTDSNKCHIALDDIAVAGNHHYPCIIYLREQGNPIGPVNENIRIDRKNWIENHNTHNDPICKKNCLDCIVKYNNTYEKLHQ